MSKRSIAGATRESDDCDEDVGGGSAIKDGDDEDGKDDLDTKKKQKVPAEESAKESLSSSSSSTDASLPFPVDGSFYQKYMNILEPMMECLYSQLEEKTTVLHEMTQTMDRLENMEIKSDPPTTATDSPKTCIQVNFGGELVTIDRQTVCFNSHIRWNFFSALFHPRWEAILPKDRDGNIYLDMEYSWVKRILDAYEEVHSMNQQNAHGNKVFLPVRRCAVSSPSRSIASTETYTKYVESAFGIYPTLQVNYSPVPHRLTSFFGLSTLDSVLFSDLVKETMGFLDPERPVLVVHTNIMDYKDPNRFESLFESTFIAHTMDELGSIYGLIWSARKNPNPNTNEAFTYHYRCFACITDPRTRHPRFKNSISQTPETLKTSNEREAATHLVDEYRLFATKIYTDRLHRLQYQSFMPSCEPWNITPRKTDFVKFDSYGIEVSINEREEVKPKGKDGTTAKGKKGKAKAGQGSTSTTSASSFVDKKVLLMTLSSRGESKYVSLNSDYWMDMGGATLGQKTMQTFNLSTSTTTATTTSDTSAVTYTPFKPFKIMLSWMKSIDHELLPDIGGDIASLLKKDRDNTSQVDDASSVLDKCRSKLTGESEINNGTKIEMKYDLMKLITCANDEYQHLFDSQMARCYRKLLEVNILYRLLIYPGLVSSFDVNFYPVHINTIGTFENLLATLNYRLKAITPLTLPKFQKIMTDRILYFNVEGKTVCLSKEAISRCIGESQLATRLCSDMWKEQSSTLDDQGRIIIEFPAEIFLPLIEYLRALFQFDIYSRVIFYETQALVDAAREMLNYFVITNVEAELYPKK